MDGDPLVRSSAIPDVSKVDLLLKSHKPEVRAKDHSDDEVHKKGPVEDCEPNGNVILLNNGSYRDDKGSHIENTDDKTD